MLIFFSKVWAPSLLKLNNDPLFIWNLPGGSSLPIVPEAVKLIQLVSSIFISYYYKSKKY